MQRNPGMHPALAQWISSVLGPGSLEFYGDNALAAVAIAEPRSRARSELRAPDEALDVWSAVLRGGERSLVQAKVAFVNAARASGWDDSRLAASLAVREEDLARVIAEVEHALRATHPSAAENTRARE